MLQFKTQRVKSRKEPYIRINTRKLNGISSIGLSTLYTLDYWSILHYY